MATRFVTNLSTLTAAIAASVGGDIISMAGGNYGTLVSSKVFSSQVIVKSTSPVDPAIFTYIGLGSAVYWSIEDVKFSAPYYATPSSSSATCEIYSNSANIAIRRCEFVGQNTAAGYGTGRAITILQANLITVEDCYIHRFLNGIVSSVATSLIFRRNEITDIGSDGIDMYTVTGALVDGNYIHDFRADYSSGAHCDAIQWATGFSGLTTTGNITITNNIVRIGNGSWIQNIFSNNEAYDGTNYWRYQGMVIENNFIEGFMTWGIGLSYSGAATIRNNTLVWKYFSLSDPYNNQTSIDDPGNFGPTATFAIPKLFVVDANAPCVITNNDFYGAPFSSANRLILQASEASLISAGWTISGNDLFKDNVGPTPPPFVTNFGGAVAPMVTFGPDAVVARGGY